MDRVHEAKPAPDEPAGENEAEDAGGKSNKKLQHIEFPELRWRAVTLRNAWVKDSAAACSRPVGKWYANRRRYPERILA
jgi:hypothetical protein